MKLLIPVDGSEGALSAVQYAVSLASQGISVFVSLVNVQPALSADISRFVAREVVGEFHQEQGTEAMAPAVEMLSASGLEFESEVLVGNGAQTIAEQARYNACDGIVMGSHGMGGVLGVLLGSTDQRVVHLSQVPVTLVK
jgi:nucleotide-binding universal stress UspA family protein